MEAKVAYGILNAHQTGSRQEREEADEFHEWMVGNYNPDQSGGVQVSPTSGGGGIVTDDDLKFDTNYIYAFLDSMIANICPTNPQITINARIPDGEDAAKANETLINDTLRRNQVHDVLWEAAMRCGLARRGVAKTVWSTTRKMPVVQSIDTRAFFYDQTVPFRFTRYVCEATVITMSEFKNRRKRGSPFKYNAEVSKKVTPSGYPAWLRGSNKNDSRNQDDAAREELQWVLVYEFYDLVDGNFFHFADGQAEPLLHLKKLPYKFVRNPYTLLIFNKDLNRHCGVADARLIRDLLRRLNELDTIEIRHAHKTIPRTLVNVHLVDDPEDLIDALSAPADVDDIIQVKGRENAPVRDIIGSTPTPNLPTSVGVMREHAMGQINFTLGFADYLRGKMGQSDVATELALVDTATRTRNGRRVKVMGDFVVDIAKKIGGLWQEFIADRTIPVRADITADAVLTTRMELGFDDDGPFAEENVWEDTWSYDFEPVAFSPTENHRLVLLNKLQTFLEFLANAPNVDKARLQRKLLELLGMSELFESKPVDPMAQQVPGGQPSPPGESPSGTPADSVSTGKMPEGSDVEDLNTVDARAMAQQPAGLA